MIYSGQLNINVVSAVFKKDHDTFGNMDPYVTLTIGQNEFRTDIKKGAGKTPAWNQNFTCFINGEQSMDIAAFDDDAGKDDLIGKDTISLAQVFQQKNVFQNYPLYNKKHEQEGTVTIGLAFQPKV